MATPRDRARAQTMTEITKLGRQHLSTFGAAGLSLRAVARDLGVVSSAVYRYVPSRDDLLTLLVVDAYTELGAAVTRAESVLPRADVAGRWRALADALREWALAEPSRYGLVFGAPVPGYHAPSAQTNAPGTQIVLLLMRLAADAELAGAHPAVSGREVPLSLRRDAERVRRDFEVALSDEMLTATLLTWVALFGAVNFEVFGQYGPDTFTDPDAVFAALVDLLGGVLGLPSR